MLGAAARDTRQQRALALSEQVLRCLRQHDYCYRHGANTYGLNRDYCDQEFLQNMQNSCPAGSSSPFGKFFEIIDNNVDSRTTCLRIANDFHMAAQDFGEKHFQSETSTYCEYNGAP